MTLLTMTVTAPKLMTDLYKWGADDDYVFENETLAAGSGADNAVDVGTMLGRKPGTASVTRINVSGSNKGAITLADPAYGAGVKNGSYRVVCLTPYIAGSPATPAEYALEDPDGVTILTFKAGDAVDSVVKFTKASGTGDAVGDVALIKVAVTPGKVVPLDLTATDGSQNFACFALAKKVAKDGGSDVSLLTLNRGPSIVRLQGIIWPAGITDDQKVLLLAQAADVGIIARPS